MTKQRKDSKEIAIEIREQEIEYNKALDECRRLAALKAKQYDQELNKLKLSTDKTYEQIIKKLGRILEKGLLKDRPWKVSAKLKRDLKGFIHRSTVYKWVEDNWRDSSYNVNPTGKNRATMQDSRSDRSSTPLTQQEQQYVKSHEDEYRRNHLVDELLELWTGKTKQQQDEIMLSTLKGSNWRKKLVDESREHMFTVFKQMTDSYVTGTVNDMRTIVEVASAFGDVGYEEQELRKRKAAMESA